jgi:hypothetical protein
VFAGGRGLFQQTLFKPPISAHGRQFFSFASICAHSRLFRVVVQYKTISPNVKRGDAKKQKGAIPSFFFEEKQEKITPWSSFSNSFEIKNREAITPDLGGLPDMINVPGFKNCTSENRSNWTRFVFYALLLRNRRRRQLVEKTRQPRFLVGGFVVMNNAAVDQFVEQRYCRVQVLLDGLPVRGSHDFFERRPHFRAILPVPQRLPFGLTNTFDCRLMICHIFSFFLSVTIKVDLIY